MTSYFLPAQRLFISHKNCWTGWKAMGWPPNTSTPTASYWPGTTSKSTASGTRGLTMTGKRCHGNGHPFLSFQICSYCPRPTPPILKLGGRRHVGDRGNIVIMTSFYYTGSTSLCSGTTRQASRLRPWTIWRQPRTGPFLGPSTAGLIPWRLGSTARTSPRPAADVMTTSLLVQQRRGYYSQGPSFYRKAKPDADDIMMATFM